MAQPPRPHAPSRGVRALLVGPTVGRPTHPQRDAVLREQFGLETHTVRGAAPAIELAAGVDAVVIEHGKGMEAILDLLPRLKRRAPELIVILINGGLTQMQKGMAFYQGAADYFPLPGQAWQWEALAARIVSLVERRRGSSDRSVGDVANPGRKECTE